MDIFADIADERRAVAGMLADLPPENRSVSSLCDGWTVHHVAAHLIMPLTVSMPAIMVAMIASGGNFDRANNKLTKQLARRPFEEIIEILQTKADKKFTPPGAGPEAPLTDILVHGLDIRWPLGLPRQIPEQRLRTALTHLTTKSANGVATSGVLTGRRFEATDVDWSYGEGPLVSGAAGALLLALTGRTVAVAHLAGEGAETWAAELS